MLKLNGLGGMFRMEARAAKAAGWWGSLRLAWYARGVVAAFAIVALLDQLKVFPPDYLKVIHFIGVGWHTWMSGLTEWLNFHLPVHLTPSEGTWLVFVSSMFLPMAVGKILNRLKQPKTLWVWFSRIIVPAVGMVWICVAPLLEPDAWVVLDSNTWAGEPTLGQSLSFSIAYYLSALLIIIHATNPFNDEDATGVISWVRRRYVWLVVPGVVYMFGYAFLSAGYSANETTPEFLRNPLYLGATYVVLGIFAFWAGLVLVGYGTRMWQVARDYSKALVITLTCIATLELIYLAPLVQQWTQPLFDQVGSRPEQL